MALEARFAHELESLCCYCRSDPRCKGGIVRWVGKDGQKALFAVNPASLTSRVNETIFASVDDGLSFSHRKLRIDSSGGYGTINLNSASARLCRI